LGSSGGSVTLRDEGGDGDVEHGQVEHNLAEVVQGLVGVSADIRRELSNLSLGGSWRALRAPAQAACG
jgi:hypothetical protein